MHHLSHDRMVAVAEGHPPRKAEERHLASCPACEREKEAIAALLAIIRSGEDAPLPLERLEANAARIDARIAALSPRAARPASPRWRLVVPLAAAAVIAVLPRARDSAVWPVFVTGVPEAHDLSEDEFDVVLRCLVSATDELGVIQNVIDRRTSPWEDIGELSGDELEDLLEIMGVNGLG